MLQVPPTGILREFSQYYRPVMGALCIVLTMLMRLGITNTWMAIVSAVERRLPGAVDAKKAA